MATRHPNGVDPRVLARLEEDAGVKPVVAVPRNGLPTWALILGMVVAAIILFIILDSRRRALDAPAIQPGRTDATSVTAAPPPLFVPPAVARVVAEPVLVPEAAPPLPEPTPAPVPSPPPAPQIIYVPQPTPMPLPVEAPMLPARTTTDPALVIDTGTVLAAVAGAAEAQAQAASASVPGASQAGGRARAGMLANRATTVPQGTLIPAVLETALDSNRPGYARAIVSRNVRGFDGSRVLIPRGSRLIGEYRSDAAPGQRRALISWTRLIRPDGVTITIDSPAGDPLGRGGIRARVNSHFFARFAGAILQSVLDIGVNLAGRAAGGTIVVLPGGAQTVTQTVQPSQITPTLTVRQGTSISIFVARDLDFTGAESRR